MRNINYLKLLIAAISFLPFQSFSQLASPTSPKYYWSNKDFSKDVALFRAKAFVLNNILGTNDNIVQFEMDPLAAASSGELTSLVYKSKQLDKEGLILGFFGNTWNSSGVIYQAYAFKNLTIVNAVELLNKIESVIKDKTKYLNSNPASNNVTFNFEDLTFIITMDVETNIRVFWGDFDASWDGTAFKRTKKRLLKRLE